MQPQLKGRYFIDDREIAEPHAAKQWFHYADEHEIDVARAISLWEDAATPDGHASRDEILRAGIRIVPPER
ncbi:hypothetical protein [Paraburkholderia caballeronis]|uniref:Uncharacterized protein n=1 Tax=Paraburkholderia caballeronis TaxID=416943 RepID=A0A1H7JUH0_9BURK|nr:hypothetical protein [Paraburkholderia caballeronis]PXW27272.1 hypothetical protein C7403_103181 [Paraburkholderia caballeronis]PXX02746.1 hypothetical protein C7407_103181 [Paraburkholderia caballeronis]RAK03471.1 hypothetical protein C7409_103181 [Paraburkholderia caballeronis]TDV17134.1 hypothetical protein C7406_10657 [Paraburkholderia caballeronis]TDV17519.1 hypothetical protein C7408_104178 [Paraburkholderia caballeronis]